ncbi:MerR family DNA-binding transcriptional regulator [Microbispora sp. CA-102843]|uniref:MerR family DNA-binding transcriptional regulator n=1 Tax=Microbispora sp. CA-102843 TaxID=3239952 RepID=UPI003D8A916A
MTSDAHAWEPAATGPAGSDGLTVGRAAALVGVSVKTLHHWDAIDLVRPSGRTWAGYAGHYDAVVPGLAVWLRDTICANAAGHGVDPESATWQ